MRYLITFTVCAFIFAACVGLPEEYKQTLLEIHKNLLEQGSITQEQYNLLVATLDEATATPAWGTIVQTGVAAILGGLFGIPAVRVARGSPLKSGSGVT